MAWQFDARSNRSTRCVDGSLMPAKRPRQPCTQARLVLRQDVVYTPPAGGQAQSQGDKPIGIGTTCEMVADDRVDPVAVRSD